MKRRWLGLAATMVFVGACGGDEGNETPSDDTGADVADTAVDTGETDSGEDATEDTGTDVEADAGEDTSDDVTADAGEDASEDAAPDVVEVECGTDSPAELAACVDGDRWWADVEALAEPRPQGSEAWANSAELCATRLEALGFVVDDEPAYNIRNVIGVREGTTRPDELVIIGGHYDTTSAVLEGGGWCAGADDNASGVAGALEVARVLAETDHERTLVVACWDHEERGLQGSQVHARNVAMEGDAVVVALSLEMIAFGSDAPDTQALPDGFSLFFEDAVNEIAERGNRGDFLAAIGDVSASDAIAALVAAGEGPGTDVVAIEVPAEYRAAVALSDLRRSDHAAFWDADLPAIMLTDTANFRNPNYHCAEGLDEVETLNRDFGVASVRMIVEAVATLLEAGDEPLTAEPSDPRVCHVDDPESCPDGQTCTTQYLTVEGLREVCAEVTGDVGLDETCEREEFGIDNCAPGLICTRYGQPFIDGDAVPACRPLCTDASDCLENERCQASGNYPFAGVCVVRCSPADLDACIEGTACVLGGNTDSTSMGSHCAGAYEVGEVGTPCEDSGDCGAGHGCAIQTGTCQMWCDDEHPCEGDTPCTPYGRVTDVAGLGFCIE